MNINSIHSFLVHPAKHEEEQPDIRGTSVSQSGRLFEMLHEIYKKAGVECNIEIVFEAADDGSQDNICRDLLISYLRSPTLPNGRAIASRLQIATTKRSGLGLLFLMKGRDRARHRLVVSRFPADRGILAHEGASRLTVEFLERVFMKSATAYKSALYADSSLTSGFRDGWAIDRQINSSRELSTYWIREFLLSDFRTTGPAGTRRVATALRDAVRRAPSLDVKEELISVVRLLRGQAGRSVSGRSIVEQFGLSQEAATSLRESFGREELYEDRFRLSRDELDRHLPFRSVELDTGAILTGDEATFDDVFQKQVLCVADNRVRYSTDGRVIDQKLRKSK